MIKFLVLTTLITLSSSSQLDKFTWNFYKTFANSKENENFIISPSSLSLVLGMAMEGAVSETRSEIESQLNGVEFSEVSKKINGEGSVRSANKVYISSDYTLNPTYEELAIRKFQSKAESVNFAKSDQTASKINKWIEEVTEGHLKNVVDPSTLTDDTKMILLNAIFFKGEWVNGFKLNNFERNFFKSQSEKISLKFMETDEKKFNYAESGELKAEIIELPYANTEVKMFILLPNFDVKLADLEAKLDDQMVDKLIKSMKPTDAVVVMPKIKIESDYSFNEDLKKLGMSRMFSNAAQFENFLENSTARLKVSDVHQKAKIDINEKGTIAAAATDIKFVLLCGGCGPVDFIVNRPFLFLIRDGDVTYFMGRVVEPSS